jgi:hypothetical protein
MRTPPAAARAAALCTLAALALTGCALGGSTPGKTSSKAPVSAGVSAGTLEDARELSACIRGKGFTDFRDPDPTTGEFVDESVEAMKTDPALMAAYKECSGTGENKG